MKSTIYNIIAFVAVLISAASCIVDDSDVNIIDSYDLTQYSKKKVAMTVALPLEALELAIELDEYINLPEDQKPSCKKFHENCEMTAPGLYSLRYDSTLEFRCLRLSVDTGGKSIWEQDAEWTFHEFMLWGNDFGYSSYDYDWELPQGTKLMMLSASDSTWAVNADAIATKMKMLPKYQDSLYVWSVKAQGSEESEIDVKAEYGTKSDLLVREILLESDERTNSYSGSFYVDIYRNGEPLDYCYASFDFNRETQYNTSR